jgi:hypothetical protein
MNSFISSFIILTGLMATTAQATEVNLGSLKIQSISADGSFRAAVLLKGADTPYFRLDCIDRTDPEGDRSKNTILVVDSKNKIGIKNHQLFTGVHDFYCQGISHLFENLKVGDTVNVKLQANVRTDEFRGGTEFADISQISVQAGKESSSRTYDMPSKPGSITGFLTSRELLN